MQLKNNQPEGTPRIAVLDLNNGYPNQGFPSIKQIVANHLHEFGGSAQSYDVRKNNEIPSLHDYDIFISSGGPGSPLPAGHSWEAGYFKLMDDILDHNERSDQKKYVFLICHSFQMLSHHWKLGTITKRKSYSFGVMPVHKTDAGRFDPLLKDLPDPYFAVDSRDYQVVQPNIAAFERMGAKILSIEKYRPAIKLERCIMAIRFTPEIIGTQYHPEAEPAGMTAHLKTLDRKKAVVTVFGEEKYCEILEDLEDEDKIKLTCTVVLPGFLTSSYSALREEVLA